MSCVTGISSVRQQYLPMQRWETTRRIVYDPEQDETEQVDQFKINAQCEGGLQAGSSHHPRSSPQSGDSPQNDDSPRDGGSPPNGSSLPAQPDVAALIQSTQALFRSSPRFRKASHQLRQQPRFGRHVQRETSYPESTTLFSASNKEGSCERPRIGHRPKQATLSTVESNTVKNMQRLHSSHESITSAKHEKTKKESTDQSIKPMHFSRDEWIIEEFDYTSRWYMGYHGRWVQLGEKSWQFNHSRHQPKGSLGYTPPYAPRRKVTFMSLPPEIRNTVYEYAIPERAVLIKRTHPKRETRTRPKSWADEDVAVPLRSRLIHELELGYYSTDFVDALSLLLTSKKVKHEVETFLYSSLLFCFHSLKSLRRFLRVASKSGLKSMRKLYIVQDGYGNSQLTVDQQYRERYYQNWEKVYTQVGQMAPHIRHLKLGIYDTDWPSQLSGKAYNPTWKPAILKVAPELLPKVEVRVQHKMLDQNKEVLRDLARWVEDSMMTQEGRDKRNRRETERVLAEISACKAAREEKERKRQAKLNAPPPRSELTISMNDVQNQVNKAPASKKFRSKGLEMYEKVESTIYSSQP